MNKLILDLWGMDSRVGKIDEINKFDFEFFGVIDKVADVVDPPARILVEVAYEAIIDADQSNRNRYIIQYKF